MTLVLLLLGCGSAASTGPEAPPDPIDPVDPIGPVDPVDPEAVRPLVIRLLDVGRGDATLIENGESRVIIDGGRRQPLFAEHVDAFGLDGSRIEAVILTHTHGDHASGLRELFRSDRDIEIGYFFDNLGLSASSNSATELRDSASARAERGELIYRDAADPCGDGSPICTLRLDGEARLHVMRPYPDASNTDDGSIPAKLVGPDSASFTMWLAGDARHAAVEWFEAGAGYHLSPGMRVNVLKGQEHGNCRALPQRLLDLADPEWVTFSLDEEDASGRIHEQTKSRLVLNDIPWYRTDRNGTITITSPGTPGGGYSIGPRDGAESEDGIPDDLGTSPHCP